MNAVRGFLLAVVTGLVLLTGCAGGQVDDELHFLRQKPSNAPDMTGLTEGRLVLSEKCLYLESEGGNLTHAAIWPFEFSLTTQGGSVQILNEGKAVVAQVGDQLRVSGGEVPQLPLEDFEENFIGTATQCAAPYWRINNDVEVIAP